MYDFEQKIREATLDIVKDKTSQEKADALNLIESIISQDMSVEDLVEAIGNGSVPVTYIPRADKS